MSHWKLGFAVLLLTAIANVVPQAHAAPVLKVMIVGASGSWQAMGVGAYKGGNCPTNTVGACAHYSHNSFNLSDSRPTSKGGSTVTDAGAIWIVWDKTVGDPTCTACNVWAYIKVDSIVGNRCYFARPHCLVAKSPFPAAVSQISLPAPAWGPETMPPASIQALFTTGVRTNVAASEIRPEDALFGQCRINSAAGGGSDGLNGLGLGTNASGVCPTFADPLAKLLGTDLTSSYPASTSTAHPVAFNISGHDPFTNSTIPAYSQASVGASPLIFITSRQNELANVKNATMSQLQTLFSGTDCTADVLSGGTAGAPIDVYIREPLSGTMNTAEYTTFRLPLGSGGSYGGISQETGLTGLATVNGVNCGGSGKRYSGIGTGEEVKFVQNSNTQLNNRDGIGYAFFSYGNVSAIAGNANYAYLTVDGIDPIFQVYGSTYDPAQSTIDGALPTVADLPATCASGGGNFPCNEQFMWKGKLSYPNLRSGAYRQWCVIRLISDGATFTNAQALVASTQQSVVNTVPDFVPLVATTAGGFSDPGLFVFHSHYTQVGVAPLNQQGGDKGGEEGGCIVSKSSGATKLVQRNVGCVQGQ
jgi:hypothetical protein